MYNLNLELQFQYIIRCDLMFQIYNLQLIVRTNELPIVHCNYFKIKLSNKAVRISTVPLNT